MLSSKVKTLSKDDLERYKEKIAVVGGRDPYTFSYDSKVLPVTVDYDIILCYLLNTLSFRTGVPVRNHKSLEACKSFERGFVKEVKGRKCDHIFAVSGKVLHSMRINEPPAECWILIQDEKDGDVDVGEIRSAHCDCTAGAGETCSHVAAVLYALSYARDTCLGKKVSVTQLPAYWMQPSGSAQQNLYKPVEAIDFGRTVATNCDLRDYSLERTDDELKQLVSQISGTGQDVAASRIFLQPTELFPEEAEEVNKRKYAEYLSFSKLFDESLSQHSLQELIEHGKQMFWKLDEDDCELVESLTRDQSSDPLWFSLRYGRITASTFAKCVKTKLDHPSISLIKLLCTFNKSQELPATLHGKRNERKAVSAAIDLFRFQKHENFKERKCGLVINPKYPYFAASPDHLFECSCCKMVVVEVKCPFKFENMEREEGIESLLSRQNPYLVKDSRGNISMNHKHEYFYQVQMQIFISEAEYGLFVVWAPLFTLYIKVKKNESFWEYNSRKASEFFENVLVAEILSHYFTHQIQPN